VCLWSFQLRIPVSESSRGSSTAACSNNNRISPNSAFSALLLVVGSPLFYLALFQSPAQQDVVIGIQDSRNCA